MKEPFKDTDLREALRRKYSDTPQLPSDFMAKMQEQMGQHLEPSMPTPATKRRLWRWVAAAACLLAIIGIGVTMLPKGQVEQKVEIYAQANQTEKTVEESEQIEQGGQKGQEGQQVSKVPSGQKQNEAQHPTSTAKANQPVVATTHTSPKKSPSLETSQPTEKSPSTEVPTIYRPAKDDNLHYASQSHTEDTTYQAPCKMDEFIAKIAGNNKVEAVPLDCLSDKKDDTVVNKAYVFQDTQELDLFGRLLQAACWYDSKTPGYLLNFSHQQFFFTLKDLRKGEKYLWMAERINGNRILLFTTHSPIDANISSACYQNFREQLTHTYF